MFAAAKRIASDLDKLSLAASIVCTTVAYAACHYWKSEFRTCILNRSEAICRENFDEKIDRINYKVASLAAITIILAALNVSTWLNKYCKKLTEKTRHYSQSASQTAKPVLKSHKKSQYAGLCKKPFSPVAVMAPPPITKTIRKHHDSSSRVPDPIEREQTKRKERVIGRW